MNEAFVTFQGWVGNEVVHRETPQGNVRQLPGGVDARGPQAQRRAGSTARPRGSPSPAGARWPTTSRDSVRKGDPVVVHGRLRTDVWEREDGQQLGDLRRRGDLRRPRPDPGHQRRSSRRPGPSATDAEDETDQAVKELVHDSARDLPQLDSSASAAEPRPSRRAAPERGRRGRDRADFSGRPAPVGSPDHG